MICINPSKPSGNKKTRRICSDGFMIFLNYKYHFHLAWKQVWKWWWCNWIKYIPYDYFDKDTQLFTIINSKGK